MLGAPACWAWHFLYRSVACVAQGKVAVSKEQSFQSLDSNIRTLEIKAYRPLVQGQGWLLPCRAAIDMEEVI